MVLANISSRPWSCAGSASLRMARMAAAPLAKLPRRKAASRPLRQPTSQHRPGRKSACLYQRPSASRTI